MVLYMALLRAFFSLQAEKKRKKRCGGAVGRRGDGRGVVQAVMAPGMMAEGRRGWRRGGWWSWW